MTLTVQSSDGTDNTGGVCALVSIRKLSGEIWASCETAWGAKLRHVREMLLDNIKDNTEIEKKQVRFASECGTCLPLKGAHGDHTYSRGLISAGGNRILADEGLGLVVELAMGSNIEARTSNQQCCSLWSSLY